MNLLDKTLLERAHARVNVERDTIVIVLPQEGVRLVYNRSLDGWYPRLDVDVQVEGGEPVRALSIGLMPHDLASGDHDAFRFWSAALEMNHIQAHNRLGEVLDIAAARLAAEEEDEDEDEDDGE